MLFRSGLPFERYAFPNFGVPEYRQIGPEVEPSVVYSIVRQESAFNPRVVSSANAIGLMQVTPAAGRDTARRFNVTFDQRRLSQDTAYNAQLGTAELGLIVRQQVAALQRRLADRRLKLEVTQAAQDWLVLTGYDSAYGARPLRRLVQTSIGDQLAREILAGNVPDGGSVTVDVDQDLADPTAERLVIKVAAQ